MTISARSSPTCQRSDPVVTQGGPTRVRGALMPIVHTKFRRLARAEFQLLLVNWTSSFLEDLKQPVGRSGAAGLLQRNRRQLGSARRLRLRLPPNRRMQPFRVNPEGVVATETAGVVKLRHSDRTADLHSPLGTYKAALLTELPIHHSVKLQRPPPPPHNLIRATDPWGWRAVLISVTGEQPVGSPTSAADLSNSTIPSNRSRTFVPCLGCESLIWREWNLAVQQPVPKPSIKSSSTMACRTQAAVRAPRLPHFSRCFIYGSI